MCEPFLWELAYGFRWWRATKSIEASAAGALLLARLYQRAISTEVIRDA